MRSIIFVLLTTLSLTACAECNVKEGRYSSNSGSEQTISLTLSQNKLFTVLHETWLPGHYEKRDKTKLSGSWSCSNNFITLKTNDKKYRAELIVIGENPLGLKADSKALYFKNDVANKRSSLNKEILYPDF